ncbi:D-alanyl-D-alanine carboxypeptidase family protein [Bacillus sp. DX1.1]|uniref:D-alanyl-D-alanine carboxypeptidase family protein n=1 Tax=unclassified Bacillus (in: firmicutes) TaxID=185979 RepID=UPI0025711230|nr:MULTISPECIES: D-alanyl-D-alanine carboxypeptidase family protein [unclassified Bacillus (in: firmicutes)]MDM5154497.1 D-alanyl-D-alanine carboxypeptidase family protein [Bacillus sp. DX1.1]WJE83396.1 D-alanyl-D-alanine carboxypeptidase family protein [Bacillus sp. DX3.1]
MKRSRWGLVAILCVIIFSVCWFFFHERILEKKEESIAQTEKKIKAVEEKPQEAKPETKEEKQQEAPLTKVVPQIPEPIVEAKAAVVLDAGDGKVIYKNNETEPLAPASMSKMMTAYIVLENIHKGKIHWEDQVKISAKSSQTDGAGIPVQMGDVLTVKDLYHALMIQSANNSAVALAEHLAPTEKDFVELMNQKAKQLELSDGTIFANASGLQEADGTETKMPAADVAQLAYHLVKDYPEILQVSHLSQSQLAFKNTTVTNTNKMLNQANQELYIEGMDGLKTGFTDSAGYCFTGTAMQGDRRLITVVMGTDSKEKRFTETHKLLSYGFQIVK